MGLTFGGVVCCDGKCRFGAVRFPHGEFMKHSSLFHRWGLSILTCAGTSCFRPAAGMPAETMVSGGGHGGGNFIHMVCRSTGNVLTY